MAVALLTGGCIDGPVDMEPGASDTLESYFEAHIEASDLALLVDVPVDVAINATWSFSEPEGTDDARRASVLAWHAVPDRMAQKFAIWYFDDEPFPIVSATYGGQYYEAGDKSVLYDLRGIQLEHSGTFELRPGPNALVFATKGLASTISVTLDSEIAADRGTLVEGDFVTILSSRNPGDLDEHTEVTVGANVFLEASTRVEVQHSASAVRASTIGSKGDLSIHMPSDQQCVASSSPILPAPMNVATYNNGPGEYLVSALSVAAVNGGGNELQVTVVDLPFWMNKQAPQCIP